MMNYDTFTFERKSHYNEYSPKTKLKFTTHQESNLDDVIEMIVKFLYACGYSEQGIKCAMQEFTEE